MQERRSKIAVLMQQQQVCVNIVEQATLKTQWEMLLLIMRHDHAATAVTQVAAETEFALPTNGLGNATQDNVQSTHPASDYPLFMM